MDLLVTTGHAISMLKSNLDVSADFEYFKLIKSLSAAQYGFFVHIALNPEENSLFVLFDNNQLIYFSLDYSNN